MGQSKSRGLRGKSAILEERSRSEPLLSPQQRQRRIESTLRRKNKKQVLGKKVLLLGTGDSGKSTVFNQAKISVQEGKGGKSVRELPASEKKTYVQPIFDNILSQVKALISAADKIKAEFSKEEAEAVQRVLKTELISLLSRGLSPSFASDVLLLWKSAAISKVWQRNNEFQLLECVEYFYEDQVLERISSEEKEYLPTTEDVLHCRNRTLGVNQQTVNWSKTLTFTLFDVGGQRAERRKWITCFSNVDTIIFVAAMSEYDQVLFEDHSVQRLDEALRVWKDLVNRDDFTRTGFVLFLNKWDLFQRKVCHSPFKVTEGPRTRNEDYEGLDPMDFAGDDVMREKAVDECAMYLEEKFKDVVNPFKLGSLEVKRTIATEPKYFQSVFDVCMSKVLNEAFFGGY